VICDAEVCARAGWSVPDYAAACLDAGARFLQIRAKNFSSGALLECSEAVVRHAEGSGALIIVNDRADVARLSGAGGVHAGQDDLSPAAMRRVAGEDACVGLSTHTLVQVRGALAAPIDYVAIGPVFDTSSKKTGYDAVGTKRVFETAMLAEPSGLPVVAIGGITLERAADVLAAGAWSVAVIADLLSTGNPGARVREYLDRL
jgi:thiamine-phosphate pyrophosphorylase